MTTARDNSVNDKVCPHWSLSGRNCLLCKGGLFLPVAEHVTTYCQTTNYTSCPQFLESVMQAGGHRFSSVVERNRRRYERIPARFAFRLSEFLTEDSLENLIDDSACTVDLSPGGIRFESYRALSIDTLIKFSLNGDFINASLLGTGQVRWCRSLDDAPLFHIGIAFAEDSLASTICNRFGFREA